MTQPEQIDDYKDDQIRSNTLEMFVEVEEVFGMIENLKNINEPDFCFEKKYEKFSEILSRYQEQPHLLDNHITKLIEKLLIFIQDTNSPVNLFNAAFKYMYQISKVRTFKIFVKFLPHELSEFELVLVWLEKQDILDSENWETRYMLILWMSILVLNPFDMVKLDAFSSVENSNNRMAEELTKMERVYNLCKISCGNNDTCSTVGAFLCAKYLIRNDVKDVWLSKFFTWVMDANKSATHTTKFGQLAAIAAILKHGKREDIYPFSNMLLKWILDCDYKSSSDFLKNKYYIKIVQRLGLIFLKPRLANWRYQRGSRSLAANLTTNELIICGKNKIQESVIENEETDEDIFVPEEIEDIIEELLQGLKSASSDIRWLSAKGMGRVTNRLPKSFGDEIVGSVIEILNPLEPHEAWHGACLGIAELAKRGLLLPYRLSAMVPLLLQALVYDEMKGYMSVGHHIRDAACYMSWAFARAYEPSVLEPFVQQIACGLLVTTVFDREINCRRAASAAFQENVGRLGNFPYGIDILTKADFYSVGLRTNSYLHISEFIAQYDEYTNALIDHLIEKKVNHWDSAIRELTAKALNRLAKRAPSYFRDNVLDSLFKITDSIDINARHGAVLGIGEVVLALTEVEQAENSSTIYLTAEMLENVNELILKFIQRDQFRGMSGELMRISCIDFIKNCSFAKIEVKDHCLESWQNIIDKCITNKSSQIRDATVIALRNVCSAYYISENCAEFRTKLIEKYCKECENDLEEHIRMGYLSAIGGLPKFMIENSLDEILSILIKQSLIPVNGDILKMEGEIMSPENIVTLKWSEARRDSIKALTNVMLTIGFDTKDEITISNPKYLKMISNCFLKGLEEYTLDNRGDIGAWVREASLNALYILLKTCPTNLIEPELVHWVMSSFAQQAVEKIDRTRGLAGKLFSNLIHHSPEIPHIKCHNEIKKIFPEDSSKVLWLFADHTLPMFCSLLEYPDYSQKIILGLTASIGQLTESLIKYSCTAMFEYLRSHQEDIPRICNEILIVFERNSLNERVTYPFLNFLDHILCSGTLGNILDDETSNFADELFRLVNIEIKGHKKLYKLVSSINIYCQLLQVPRLCSKIFSKLSVFLGLTHVHVRKTTATKFYEALLIYGDTCGLSDENVEEIMNILIETDWGMPMIEVRPIRNHLCTLMGIKAPVTMTPGDKK